MPPDRASQADRIRRVERGGWFFRLSGSAGDTAQATDSLIQVALDAAAATAGVPIRRSRHAETWIVRFGGTDLFVKVLQAPGGLARLKRLVRGGPSQHVAAITAALRRDGFYAPQPVLWGGEHGAGREVIVTPRAGGILLARLLREGRLAAAEKRSMLRALGDELARLHLAGYLHGDLTAYNIIVNLDSSKSRFIFLDHERTRRTWLSRLVRPRLRNLVQLGHFDLPGITRGGRMLVWKAYAATIGDGRARRHLRRLMRMIDARRARDRRRTQAVSGSMVARREAGEA